MVTGPSARSCQEHVWCSSAVTCGRSAECGARKRSGGYCATFCGVVDSKCPRRALTAGRTGCENRSARRHFATAARRAPTRARRQPASTCGKRSQHDLASNEMAVAANGARGASGRARRLGSSGAGAAGSCAAAQPSDLVRDRAKMILARLAVDSQKMGLARPAVVVVGGGRRGASLVMS